MKTYKLTIDDLELRSCDDRLLLEPGEHTTAEIVQWEKMPNEDRKFCYVIAYWKKGSEGYEMRFIGDRPFSDDVDHKAFWKLAKMGQEVLDEEFREANS